MTQTVTRPIIDEQAIDELLHIEQDIPGAHKVLERAEKMVGLTAEDIAVLISADTPEINQRLFQIATQLKKQIYGNRIVLFAPIYISNQCTNECLYCSFKASNTELERKTLATEELVNDTRSLLQQGHKRILMVTGESRKHVTTESMIDAIETIYAVAEETGAINRINVNSAPLSVEDFRKLKKAKIGTYQLFQETYHRETYKKVHSGGLKRNYDWRLEAMDRAMEAGIDDVGIGTLFGLYDWRFELLSLITHAKHLEQKFGVGPHTISVPRLEPADGCDFVDGWQHLVSDHDFKRIVAILRIAVPYTGIILSTRENSTLRKEIMALGVSQISAGSKTNPGGYSDGDNCGSQFQLGDHRTLHQVVVDLVENGYIPSFCTACYRMGRTGKDFMDIAKPGAIQSHCEPNALASLQEYIQDFGDEGLKKAGNQTIDTYITKLKGTSRKRSETLVGRVRDGKRDQYC